MLYIGILIKQNSKITCSYDMLPARTFRARRKSLHVSQAWYQIFICEYFFLNAQPFLAKFSFTPCFYVTGVTEFEK